MWIIPLLIYKFLFSSKSNLISEILRNHFSQEFSSISSTIGVNKLLKKNLISGFLNNPSNRNLQEVFSKKFSGWEILLISFSKNLNIIVNNSSEGLSENILS